MLADRRLVPTISRLVVCGLVLLGTAACGAGSAAKQPETAAPGSGSVWVANEEGDSLTVLDAATGEVVATLTGIPSPHNVQAGTDTGMVWAVSGAGGVLGVDVRDLTVTATGATGEHPAHVVDDGHGNVYVTSADQTVTRYGHDLLVRGRTRLDGAPHGMRLDASGDVAVVANTGGGTVDVIDLSDERVTARIEVGPSPIQVAVAPDASEAFVSVAGLKQVVRVDLRRAEVTGRLRMPAEPAQVLLSDGLLFVADQGTENSPGHTVSVVDVEEFRVVAEVPTGVGPHGLTADAEGSRVWVTNAFDDSVTVIDVASRSAVDTVAVGEAPNGISFSPTPPSAHARAHAHLPLGLPADFGGVDGGHHHAH